MGAASAARIPSTDAPAEQSEALLRRLANSPDPGVAYAAMTLGLGRPVDAPEVRAARAAIRLRALWLYGIEHDHAGARGAGERAAPLLLERRLLWRRSDGVLIRPDWSGRTNLIHFPIQFYDLLHALQVMAETGHLGDPRCADALAMLGAKRLPDGGFPREDRTATKRSRVASRGTWADWGSAGARTSNPFVSAAALGVLRIAAMTGAGALNTPGEPVVRKTLS